MTKAASRESSRPFEIEDLLLALWLLIFEGLILHFTPGPTRWLETVDNSIPWAAWPIVAGLALVIFSRGSADTSFDTAVMRRIGVLGPLVFVLSLLGVIIGLIQGGENSVVKKGGADAEWPMPSVPDWIRRTAIVPTLLFGEALFRGAINIHMPDVVRTFQEGDYIMLFFFLMWSIIPFLFAVVGPRVAVGAHGNLWIWTLRFLLYAVAAAAGRSLESWFSW